MEWRLYVASESKKIKKKNLIEAINNNKEFSLSNLINFYTLDVRVKLMKATFSLTIEFKISCTKIITFKLALK